MTSPSPTAGELLKHWRGLRKQSQLDLALAAGVSQRHVSFVETGRSVPSRQMIVDLSDALQIPLRERNAILVAAGYAPKYRDEPLDSEAMAGLMRAVRRVLRQHEPFPALALDRDWNVLETNAAAPEFFGRFVDFDAWPKPRNLLRLAFDARGLRPHLARFEETAASLFARARREAPGGVIDPGLRRLLSEWDAPRTEGRADPAPMIPLAFKAGDREIELFSLVTTVAAPGAVAAQDIRVETMFPTNEAMEREYLRFRGL